MIDFQKIAYVPQLKWKAGERTAIKCFSPVWRDHMLPLFRLVQPGDFDADHKMALSEGAFLKKFGSQLFEVTGGNPVLFDGEAACADFRPESGRFPYSILLERARLAGARPIPVFQASSAEVHLQAIRRFLEWSDTRSTCFRISPSDLESIESPDEIRAFAKSLGAQCAKSVLLIDSGPIVIDDEDEYAQLLAYHLARLVRAGDWGLVVFAATSFPEKPKMAKWSSQSFERHDWKLYRKIVESAAELPVAPVFSDYALEFPGSPSRAPKGIQPIAHLRYSTENRYFIFQGDSVKNDEKFAKIFRVADQLVESGIFKGENYSSGDAFIFDLARSRDRTGSASTWRWCATDHHLSLTMKQLNSLLGLGLSEMVPLIEPDQLQLVLP